MTNSDGILVNYINTTTKLSESICVTTMVNDTLSIGPAAINAREPMSTMEYINIA